jgi:predicted dehydrogenase
VLAARCAYNTGGIWRSDRKPGESDMEWQCRNWYYFDWLSGDFIVEQHVHTLDVVNWAMGAHPVRAVGLGGRQSRTGPEHGNIYDHFAVDYEYPGGVHVLSMCRQIPGTPSEVGAWFFGEGGTAAPYDGVIVGERSWRFEGEAPNPYVEEHVDLIRSIREKRPLNETRQIAESTLTAILGREAAYTGKTLTWEDVERSDQDLGPPCHEFGALPVRPVPMPGT